MSSTSHMSTTQIVETLDRVPLLSGLKGNQKALQELSQIMEPRSYKANATLLQEGDLGNEFFCFTTRASQCLQKNPRG
jgi:CRP-like cAMP-binding protein